MVLAEDFNFYWVICLWTGNNFSVQWDMWLPLDITIIALLIVTYGGVILLPDVMFWIRVALNFILWGHSRVNEIVLLQLHIWFLLILTSKIWYILVSFPLLSLTFHGQWRLNVMVLLDSLYVISCWCLIVTHGLIGFMYEIWSVRMWVILTLTFSGHWELDRALSDSVTRSTVRPMCTANTCQSRGWGVDCLSKVVGMWHGHPAHYRHRESKIKIQGGGGSILKVTFGKFS